MFNMISAFRWSLLIAVMALWGSRAWAEGKDWKEKKSDDGRTTVRWNISTRTDEKGGKSPLIEYEAFTTDTLSLSKCIALMKDVSKHKEFQGDQESRSLQAHPDSGWLLYYFTKGPGFIPNSDCVLRMDFAEDTAKKEAVFTLTATPALYERTKAKRINLYDRTYVFRDLGNGSVRMTVQSKASPSFYVPQWMMNAAFPGAGFDLIRKFVQMAKAGA